MNEIELLKTLYKTSYKIIVDGRIVDEFIDMANPVNKALNTAISALEAQQWDRWIPVSQRLPNEEECNTYPVEHPLHGKFICTIKIGEYEPQTRELYFSKVSGWNYGPENYNRHVIAWMPLPEPWKEEQK